MDFLKMAVPCDMKLRILLLKLPELWKHRLSITAFRENNTVIHNRLKHRLVSRGFKAQSLSVVRFGKSRQNTYFSCLNTIRCHEFRAGIYSDSADFLFTDHFSDLYRSARNLDVSKPHALRIVTYLEHPCAERIGIIVLNGVVIQSLKEIINSVKLQSRAEKARKHLPRLDSFGNFRIGRRFTLKVFFHQLFAAKSKSFIYCRPASEIDKLTLQLGVEIFNNLLATLSCEVHLCHENKSRHVIGFQQLPKGACMGLNSVKSADDENCIIEHREGALRLRGKIDVTGCIKQGYFCFIRRKNRLTCKNRYSTLTLKGMGVQSRVTVIDTTYLPQLTRPIKHRLGKRCFACVNVSQNSYNDFFHKYLVKSKILQLFYQKSD